MNLQNWISLALFISYVVVFFIQKNLFDKQKGLIDIYERLSKIFGDIDGLEKYVELNKKNVELEYEIQKKEIINLNHLAKQNLEETESILNKFTLLDEDKVRVDSLMEKTKKYIEHRKDIDDKLLKFAGEEIDKIYEYISSESNKLDEPIRLELEKNILFIKKEYIIKKTDILESRKQLDEM
jgi:Na+/phosphate symporter